MGVGSRMINGRNEKGLGVSVGVGVGVSLGVGVSVAEIVTVGVINIVSVMGYVVVIGAVTGLSSLLPGTIVDVGVGSAVTVRSLDRAWANTISSENSCR